jgi:hypothetical protein
MWIGTYDNGCSHHKINVLCGLESMWKELFTTNLIENLHFNRSEMMLSWHNMRCYVYWNRCEIMLSWPNWNCYVDRKECDKKLSQSIWITMWIISDDIWWCHDLNWGALWIGYDVNECCHDQIWSAMWTGNDVTGSFHDQYEVLCGLEQMIGDDVLT